jgi:hypothetical protein
VDIFYPQIFELFDQNGVFQHPQAFALKSPAMVKMGEIEMFRPSLYHGT